MNIVQQIITFIEGRRKENWEKRKNGAGGNLYWERAEEDKDILSFIDSLQEESVDIDAMTETYRKRLVSQANGMNDSPLVSMCLASYKHGIQDILSEQDLANSANISKNLQEEPVSEGLEDAALEHFPKMSIVSEPHGVIPADNKCHRLGDANVDKREGFIVGALWQKQQEYTCYEEAFEDGCKWMKEKLIKDAIDAEVVGIKKQVLDGSYGYIEIKGNYKEGDKLKVITIKEDKQ